MAKQTPGRKAAPSLKARVARNIAARRKALAWTQEQLATAAGINAETVSRYERGTSLPSLEALERLAGALGSDIALLVAATGASGETPEDARLLAARLGGLGAEDRTFVLGLLDSAVHLLQQRRPS